jgi:hypothetical protein
MCNVHQYLIPGVSHTDKIYQSQEKFLPNEQEKRYIKIFRRPALAPSDHTESHVSVGSQIALSKGCIAIYNFTSFELMTFTFSSGSESISIDKTGWDRFQTVFYSSSLRMWIFLVL